MPTSPIIIAGLMGVVAAGFVWFGWSLIENIFFSMDRFEERRKAKAAGEDEAKE